ncbi:helix-turn-helix domain-containing protein [Streptomyces lavendofoliae]|uniref:Cyclic diguanylate phosphodiesterase n=1 Tax=Streptomyces lavendofoliae TaxID=67314 RepID=A0A918M4D3_9ACTN|nr:GAF domain-containing protein [Streptomyces lavendofoliae]GGU37695.1 cyclic diguanylate phosphodiesterase [Streptomyces lavendofoliae]
MAGTYDGIFLELLLKDADISAFDEVLAAARAAGEPAGRLAELEEERALALRLRERHLRHRRNEAELQLLNDTANDLASLRELDSILQAISDRARRLLECDLAYISLSDRGRGDSYIKAAAGNISGLLRELRLPVGSGIGGIVARTGEPYTVTSYLTDDSFTHTTEIDRTVAAERIESLLGVPVKLGQEVIGVLLAAHRSRRGFSSRDISVLVMLGAHAAVAIENARLLNAAQAAVAELRIANDTISSHMADLERTAEVHERLTRLVIQGKGVDEVAQATATSLGGTVVVLDEDGDIAARSRGQTTIPVDELRAIGSDARETGTTVVRGARCAVPLITESEALGAIVSAGTTPETRATDRRILERAALVASLVLVTRRRVAEAEARVRGELLSDLLTAHPKDHDLLRHRAALIDIDLDACRNVVVARVDDDPRDRIYASTAAFARRSHGLATIRRDTVILLLPGDDPMEVARTTARELSRTSRHPVTAGTARAADITGIPAAYREADECLRALIALDRTGEIADARGLGFVGALFSGRPAVASLIESVLGPVIAYDDGHRSDLVRTLDAYCRTGRHARNTARRLHLHVNTVTQRLARIGRLLGDDWREPERLLEIQVALRLLKVSNP